MTRVFEVEPFPVPPDIRDSESCQECDSELEALKVGEVLGCRSWW
jgi:hypothetical protein